MQIRTFRFIAAALIAAVFHGVVFAAGEHAGKDDAVAFVKKAAAYLKQNGKDKALEEFNNPKGQFIDGELYVVVLDMNGVLLADGTKPRLVGKSLADIKDVNGKLWRARVQVYDAPFSLKGPDSLTLHVNGVTSRIKGAKAAPVFDDTKKYLDKATWLSAEDKAKIFSGNALRVYPRLPGRLKAVGLNA